MSTATAQPRPIDRAVVTVDQVAAFQADGCVVVRGLFSPEEVEVVRAGIERNLADPGPLFLSGELRVEGLRLHDRETVGHLANFGPGTPLTETLVLDFQDRLQKSGLFERASVAVEATPDQAAAAPVSVQVEESPRQQLVLGVGVSANTGPRATVEHIDRRLFGRAATARNKVEWGGARQAWDGEVSTHPGPRLYRWLAGGTIEQLKTDTDVVLTQRLRAGRVQDSPRIERFQFVEVDRSARKTDSESSSSVAVAVNHHWAWRDVDNPVLPTRGLTASLQAGSPQAARPPDRQGQTRSRPYPAPHRV